MSEKTSYAPGTPCWVDLMTPDLDAAKAFYTALFGWDLEDAGPESGGYHMASLRGKPVAGLGPTQEGGPPMALWTTYFHAADAEARAAAIRDGGGQVMFGPIDVMGQGTMIAAADPAGAMFGIWQPAAHIGAQIINEHATLVWNELSTPDLAASAQFYGSLFPYTFQDIEEVPSGYKVLQIDGHAVGGMLQMTEQMQGVPPHWMTYFHVDDVDGALATVADLGGKTVLPEIVDSPYGRFNVVTDPQGGAFTLMQSAAPGAG
jgi:predicted enzyme related to lactoylglutathione lyase